MKYRRMEEKETQQMAADDKGIRLNSRHDRCKFYLLRSLNLLIEHLWESRKAKERK